MTVREAVERREDAVAAAPAKVSPEAMVKEIIAKQAAAFTDILPSGIDPARWSRIVMTSVRAKPKLIEAFQSTQGRTSILLSAMLAASLGLEPDTPTQECSLQPRSVKRRDDQGRDYWSQECELSIGYRGYSKLARNTGDVRSIVAGVVRVGDEFAYSRGLDTDEFRHVEHSDEGDELTHAYAIVRFADGGTAWTVMTRRQIEKRRAESESWKNERARSFSPWTKWPEEMWRKTALRQLLTHGEVPLSPELARANSSDERALEAGAGTITVIAPDEAPALTAGPPASGSPTSDEAAEPEPQIAGEAGDREAPDDAPEVAPTVPSSVGATSPASPPRATPTKRDIAIQATRVFPCDDAPKGKKSKTQERLRHAVVYAVTSKRTATTDDCTPEELTQVALRLNDIAEGRMGLTFDYEDTGGARFTWGENGVLDIMWSDLEAPAGDNAPAAEPEAAAATEGDQ